MPTSNNTSRTVKAVDTSFEILEEVLHRDGAGVTELADALSLSKGTVHHHLASLEKQYFVSNREGQYTLGLGALVYGGHAQSKDAVFTAGKQDVDKLARITNETARLIVEHAGYGLTLYQSVGQKVDNPRTHIGTMEQLHSTAAGKAFLAALPVPDVNDIVDERGLEGFTSNTIQDRDELIAELEQIRSDGIAFDDCEQFDDIRCIATTFTTEDSGLLGAISISAPAERMGETRFRQELPRRMKNLCEVIEQVDHYQFQSRVPCISRTRPL
ncbi:IclR family transcriptional regulator [Halococcus sp. IIIV-5B]|uniref:IclR family transcriptional regulator n=1 Tax=Halococcus sp. IIIV-5B TaxID=2321230 RepID=UPI000E7634EA|nr:IclR family transcriptional regulator [Halococcus sp. IIIV-5B]RJT01485.1 IclR family transcriptional regulator [Halococcus sp. IIIV-5B]